MEKKRYEATGHINGFSIIAVLPAQNISRSLAWNLPGLSQAAGLKAKQATQHPRAAHRSSVSLSKYQSRQAIFRGGGVWNYNSIKQFSRAVPKMPTRKDVFFYPKQRCASTAARTPAGTRGEASGATSTDSNGHRPREQTSMCTHQTHRATPYPAPRHRSWMEDGDWRETVLVFPDNPQGRIPRSASAVTKMVTFQSKENFLAKESLAVPGHKNGWGFPLLVIRQGCSHQAAKIKAPPKASS